MNQQQSAITTACQSIWSDSLGQESCDFEKTFIELGGSSLSMVMLVWNVNEQLATNIDIVDFIDKPTFNHLIKLVNNSSQLPVPSKSMDIAASVVYKTDTALPMAYSQKGLWLIDKLEGPSAKYNVVVGFDIQGKVNSEHLAEAFRIILDRHHILNTRIIDVDGEPNVILPKETSELLHYVDISDIAREKKDKELQRLIDEAAHYHFSLSEEVLLRATLIRTNESACTIVVNMHHIISDGWSVALIASELSQLMTLFAKEQSPQLEPLSAQFFDFAKWQNDFIDSDNYNKQLSYWQKQLAGLESQHDIPLDYPRPEHQSIAGDYFRVNIDKQLFERTKSLAKRHGVTLFAVTQAVYAILVRRWSNANDIAIGTPYASRWDKTHSSMIGFFANTLVIRNDLSENISFSQFLSQTSEVCKQALLHQDVPFDKVVEVINPRRESNQNPFFQIFFALQDNETIRLCLPDCSIKDFIVPTKTAKFDISLQIFEKDDAVEVLWEYKTDIFKPETIKRFAQSYSFLLNSLIEAPEQLIDCAPLMSMKCAQKTILGRDSSACVKVLGTIHEIFNEQLKLSANRIALRGKTTNLTYQELDEQSGKIASYLLSQGLKPGEHVGIYAIRSIQMIVAVLGVMKAGGVYCALDIKLPDARLEYIVSDAALELVLQYGVQLPPNLYEGPHVSITELLASEIKLTNTLPLLKEDHPAYLVYTSGSTGRPKGVLQRHRTICNLVVTQELTARYTILQFSPCVFDAFIQELATAWHCGSDIVLMDEAQKDNIPAFPSLLHQHKIERMILTPALLNVLCEEIELNQFELPAMRELIVGGEALHLGDGLRHFLLRHPRCCFWNHYGPMETHVVTIYKVDAHTSKAFPPIGRMIDNCHGYILNQSGCCVPVGAVGEFCISGAALAAGYQNSKELTEKKFVKNAFDKPGHHHLYKTGDLVQWKNDNLYYVGRTDDQIKLRGFRIEPGEVNHNILAHKQVSKCFVTLRKINQSDTLCAYIVLEPGSDEGVINEIKQQCLSELPNYMLPDNFVILKSMPHTLNGKVDRNALNKIIINIEPADIVTAKTKNELKLVQLWENVLGSNKDQLSADTSFFQVGGHSLVLVKLHNAIIRTFKTELSLAELFKHDTVQSQGRLIDSLLDRPLTDSQIPKTVVNRSNVPLSFQQKRLWYIANFSNDKSSYNIPFAYRLSGDLCVASLQSALNCIVKRHPIIHTVYKQVNGEIHSELLPEPEAALSVTDITDDVEQNEKTSDWIKAQSKHVFDLSNEVMLYTSLLKLSDKQYILLLNMHHIASDGRSIELLLSELKTAYAKTLKGQLFTGTNDIQYADYAAWQQVVSTGPQYDHSLQYWLAQLDGAPSVHNLPLDFPRPTRNSSEGRAVCYEIPKQLCDGLISLAEDQQTTVFMMLEAVFALLAGRWSKQDDIVIGTPVAGRHHPQIESVIGLFVNMLPLRHKLDENTDFTGYLQSVKNVVVDALGHQDYPFEILVAKLDSQRSTNYSPVFQLTFSMSDSADTHLALNGIETSPIPTTEYVAKFDLSLHIEKVGERYQAFWTYSKAIFDESTIEQMAKSYLKLLSEIVANPNECIDTYPIVDDSQKEAILVHGGFTSEEFIGSKDSLFTRFQQRVIRHPDAIAVADNTSELSYSQLLENAGIISAKLQASGRQQNQVIGIYLPRSTALIESMMAVIKLCSCFVVLDTALPPERLAFQADNCNVDCIIHFEDNEQDWFTPYRTIVYSLEKVDFARADIQYKLDSTAYIIYTSGSTGTPKGVKISQRSLLNLCDWRIKEYDVSQHSTVTQISDMSFDAALWDVWSSLMAGARLQIVTDEQRTSPTQLKQLLLRHRVTHTLVPTGLLEALADQDVFNTPELRYVLTGGDRLGGFVLPKDSRAALVNLYGPTEATVAATGCQIYPNQIGLPAIGRPVGNYTVFVMNSQQQLQPLGALGELYIGGAGLAQGYVNNPKLTDQAFIRCPMLDNIRLYKTGDIVRWNSQHQLEYIGREDSQVKIRGYRVELAEIEQVCNQLPYIAQCKVVFNDTDKRLVAFISVKDNTANNDLDLMKKEINRHLTQSLPPYMHPSAICFIAQFPLTNSAKIDVAALHLIDYHEETAIDFLSATTSTEKALAKIWSLHLKVDKINILENFFSMGGHSLMAMKVIAEIEHDLSISLSVEDLFRFRTIEALSKLVEEQYLKDKNAELFAQEQTEEMEW